MDIISRKQALEGDYTRHRSAESSGIVTVLMSVVAFSPYKHCKSEVIIRIRVSKCIKRGEGRKVGEKSNEKSEMSFAGNEHPVTSVHTDVTRRFSLYSKERLGVIDRAVSA
jgi:hypothetical protein